MLRNVNFQCIKIKVSACPWFFIEESLPGHLLKLRIMQYSSFVCVTNKVANNSNHDFHHLIWV